MSEYLHALSKGFNNHVGVRLKRPGLHKILAPLYHEDGDMIDIFVEELGNGCLRVSDQGLSLMRLSYTFDIDSVSKLKIFNRILLDNDVKADNGTLFLDVTYDALYPAVLQLAQVIAKVSNMSLYKREVIANLFYEMLDEAISSVLSGMHVVRNYAPLLNRSELSADFALIRPYNSVYLFGIKERETPKLRLAAVSCLEFQKNDLRFKSVVIHQDFTTISNDDRQIITNAVDKQFTSLDEFQSTGRKSIERLAA